MTVLVVHTPDADQLTLIRVGPVAFDADKFVAKALAHVEHVQSESPSALSYTLPSPYFQALD